MLSYSAPGKLFISGEWAILEVGNHGLVAAVNNRVHVSLEGTVEDILITAAEFGVREVHAKYAEGKLHIDADDKQKECHHVECFHSALYVKELYTDSIA